MTLGKESYPKKIIGNNFLKYLLPDALHIFFPNRQFFNKNQNNIFQHFLRIRRPGYILEAGPLFCENMFRFSLHVYQKIFLFAI
jgi:hypothetical protein